MRVILVDDHSLFRNGLAYLFNSQPDFQVVGEAGTIQETLSLVEAKHPELILMDVGLPDGSGLEAISKILRIEPYAKIVFLTIHTSDENVFTAIRQGAKGFLIKDIPAPALLAALRKLERGELAVARATLSRMVTEFIPFMSPNAGGGVSPTTALTMREIEVLSELGAGYKNDEIAGHLLISHNTVKVHVHNILHKLKLQTRQDAAAYANRHGLTRERLMQLSIDDNSEVDPPDHLQPV